MVIQTVGITKNKCAITTRYPIGWSTQLWFAMETLQVENPGGLKSHTWDGRPPRHMSAGCARLLPWNLCTQPSGTCSSSVCPCPAIQDTQGYLGWRRLKMENDSWRIRKIFWPKPIASVSWKNHEHVSYTMPKHKPSLMWKSSATCEVCIDNSVFWQ